VVWIVHIKCIWNKYNKPTCIKVGVSQGVLMHYNWPWKASLVVVRCVGLNLDVNAQGSDIAWVYAKWGEWKGLIVH